MTELVPFVGRFHPLLVHFPIGILIVGAALQLLAWLRPSRGDGPPFGRAILVVLSLGAASAVASAVTGYLLGTSGGYSGETYTRHFWLGIGVAVTACVTAGALVMHGARPGRLWTTFYVLALGAMIAALGGAGHLGATLTHGEGYLTERAPAPLRALLARLGATQRKAPPPPADQALVYATLVQPVLTARCAACHGPAKVEGGLRLDSSNGLRKGGNAGAVLAPGHALKSEIVRRVWLPASHEDAMPPAGHRPLMPAEASVLRWWIDQGAHFDQRVIDAEIAPEVLPSVEAVLGPIALGGPRLPSVSVAAADPGALANVRALGVSVVPIAADTPFLHVHCTNVRATFGDQELAALVAIAPQVLWLDVSRTRITDAGLAVVAGFPHVTRLHLDGTQITDAGVAPLARLSRLEYLNLYGTRVTDTGLARLASLANLRSLYLWQTAVTRGGVERLRAALPRLHVEAGSLPGETRAAGAPATVAPPAPAAAPR